jgi:hypothetical protein
VVLGGCGKRDASDAVPPLSGARLPVQHRLRARQSEKHGVFRIPTDELGAAVAVVDRVGWPLGSCGLIGPPEPCPSQVRSGSGHRDSQKARVLNCLFRSGFT